MKLDKVKEQQYFNFRGVTPEFYSTYTIPAYMAKVLPHDTSRKILDIGCGFGQTMVALRMLGYENVSGVDISNESIEHCGTLRLNVAKVCNIDVYMECHRGEYDLIIMSHVLEHIEKSLIIPYISSVKSMLTKDGKFLIMVPNAQSNTDCYWAYEDFTHWTLFTTGSLYFVLRAGGFEQIEFLDPYCVEGLSYAKKKIKLLLLKLYQANKMFWNRITSSSYHKPSPAIFSYEIKALAK
ncbi:MAG: class I SAM-dependent methyltransferase [Terracidiphilus sp.]